MTRQRIWFSWLIAGRTCANTFITMTGTSWMERCHRLRTSTSTLVNLPATAWLFYQVDAWTRKIMNWQELSDSTANRLNSYLLRCPEDMELPRISPQFPRLILLLTKSGRQRFSAKEMSTKTSNLKCAWYPKRKTNTEVEELPEIEDRHAAKTMTSTQTAVISPWKLSVFKTPSPRALSRWVSHLKEVSNQIWIICWDQPNREIGFILLASRARGKDFSTPLTIKVPAPQEFSLKMRVLSSGSPKIWHLWEGVIWHPIIKNRSHQKVMHASTRPPPKTLEETRVTEATE